MTIEALPFFVALLFAAVWLTRLLSWFVARVRHRRTAPDPRVVRADALRREGRFDEALALCDEVARTSEAADAAHAVACRAAVRLQAGDAAAAVRELDDAIRLGPRHGDVLAWAYGLRSAARLGLGEAAGALEDAERAIEAGPGYADGYAHRAAARAALGDLDAADGDAEDALRLDPGCVAGLCVRGHLRHLRGDAEGAVEAYDAAARVSPGDAGILAARSSARTAAGDLAGAAEDADRAAALAPRDPAVLAARGCVRHARGESDAAAAGYEEALRIDPGQPLAANNLAWLLATRPDDTKRDGPRAAVLAGRCREAADGKNADAVGTLAAAKAECGEFAEAVRLVDRAIRLDPQGSNSFQRWRMLSAFRRGRPFRDTLSAAGPAVCDRLWRAAVLRARGRYRAALAECDAVRPLVDRDPVLLTCLGTLRRGCGDAAGAEACYAAALRLDPEEDAAHNQLAWLLACDPDSRVRDGRRAVAHAAEACRLAGGPNFDWLDTLAAARAEAGDFAAAVATQRRAIDVAPESERDDLRTRLRRYEANAPHRDSGPGVGTAVGG